MRVLISGLPLFASRLADDLQELDPSSRYIFLDTYNSKWAQLRFLLLLPFSRMLISINGVTEKSGTLEWVVRLRKKLVLQWAGSDVLFALERQQNGTIYRKYVDYATNLVDAPWTKEEVERLGVATGWGNTKYIHAFGDPVERYDGLHVVSYVAEVSQQFYGMELILAAARAFPKVTFAIYGTAQPDYDSPANVQYHGWVSAEEMAEAVRNAAVFLRLPEHDGFSFSVIEAFGYGCEVIWTMPLEPAWHATTAEEVTDTLRKAFAAVEARGMTPNFATRDWALKHYSRKPVIASYLQILHEIGK